MSMFWFPRAAGTATPPTPPTGEPNYPPVPQVYARVAWRSDDLTRLAWDGASTAGWSLIGSTLSSTSSDSWGGGDCLEMVTAGTAGSGVSWSFGTAVYTSGREYRARVALKNISGSTSAVVKLGTAADNAAATATTTNGWAWYTVDWTPGGDRTSVLLSVLNGAAATQTTRYDHAEAYEAADDVNLESLSISRGSRFDGGREAPGTLDFTVLDPENVYTPRNPASSLYPYVNAGRKVHVRATYGGRLYALGYGVIRSVTPDPFTKSVAFTAEDGLSELRQYEVSREFDGTLPYHAARTAALSAEALGTAQHSIAPDSIESSTFFDGTDSPTSLLDYLDDLNEATGTVHFCAPHVESIRPWRYTTITRATLTDDSTDATIDEDFQTLSDVSMRDESLITHQRVSWQGYEVEPSQVVVRATSDVPFLVYADERYGSTDIPEPETIYQLRRKKKVVKHKRGDRVVKRRKSVRRLKKVGERWVDPVVPISIAAGGTAVVVVDFAVPMQGLSAAVTDGGNVTTTLTKEPARLTLSMVASSADTVTAIAVTGTPYIPRDEAEATVTVTGGAREASSIDNEYVPAAGAASGLAEYLTWRYGSGRLRPEVTDQHHPNRQLELDVGSHVDLSADRWYIDADRYIVRSVEHSVSHAGLEWETTYGLEELPSVGNWFRLGSSLLDGSDVLAY